MERGFEPPALGHVSRARLHGPGSALARRVEQQQAALDAAAAAHQGDVGSGDGHTNNDEPCRLTWPELWDARMLAGNLGGAGASAGGGAGLAVRSAGDVSRTALERDWVPPWLRSHRQRYKKGPRRQRIAVDALLQYSRRLADARRRVSASPAPAWGAVNGGGGGGSPSEAARGTTRRRSRSLSLLDAVSLERPVRSEAQGQRPPEDPTPWTCMQLWPQPARGDSDNEERPAVMCGALNRPHDSACGACGALRWDGLDGQLVTRVAALMHTADLDRTTGRQLAARLRAESGSGSGAGMEVEPSELRAVVAHLVAARQQQQQQLAVGDGKISSRGTQVNHFDQAAHLLALGCPAGAGGVQMALLSWLEEQEAAATAATERQTEQQTAGEAAGHAAREVSPEGHQIDGTRGETLERAAAVSASSALLMLRRLLGPRGPSVGAAGLEGANAVEGPEAVADPRLSLPTNYVWAGQELDLALVTHRRQQQQRQQREEQEQQQLLQATPVAAAASPPPIADAHDDRVRCTALRRPLPAGTVAALLDPQASAVRAAVRSIAHDVAPMLPTVTAPAHSWLPAEAAEVARRRPREAVVMVEVPPSEWALAETVNVRWRLSGGSGSRSVDGGEWRASWDDVAAIRSRLHHLLCSYRPAVGLEAAWHCAAPWQLAEAVAAYRRDWDAWVETWQPRRLDASEEGGDAAEPGQQQQQQQQSQKPQRKPHQQAKDVEPPEPTQPRRSARLRKWPGSNEAAAEDKAPAGNKKSAGQGMRRRGKRTPSSSSSSGSDSESNSDSESDSESDSSSSSRQKRPTKRRRGHNHDGSETEWRGSSEEASSSGHSDSSNSDSGTDSSSRDSEPPQPRRHKRPEGRLVLPSIPDPAAITTDVDNARRPSSKAAPSPGAAWWAELPVRLPPLSAGMAQVGGSHRSVWQPLQPSGTAEPLQPMQQQQPPQQRQLGGLIAAQAGSLPDCVQEVLAAARAVGASDTVLARAAGRLVRLLDDGTL